MTVYKRSELTPDVLRQWQREAEFDLVYKSAPSIFELSMMLGEDYEGEDVDLRKDGRVYIGGYSAGRWRKLGNEYQFYTPGRGALSAKVIRGPWK